MLPKINLFCNAIILSILLVVGGYKALELERDLKEKALIAEEAKKSEIIEREYNAAIMERNKNIKEQLLIDFNSHTGVYICYRESISVVPMKPRWMRTKYNVLYPIKGDLKPGDSIDGQNTFEGIDNGSFFERWTFANRLNPPVEIVFVSDDPLDNSVNATNIKMHPYTKTVLLGSAISLVNNDRCKLFFEVLKEIGWDTQKQNFN